MSTKIALGIDVGGSGIKGAPVDLETGQLLAERVRIDTPSPPLRRQWRRCAPRLPPLLT